MGFKYAPLLQKFYPTVAQAWQAIRQADIADDRQRDVRPLMAILMRMAESPRIAGHITTRTAGLTSFTWDIEGPEEAQAEAAKERLTDIVNEILENHAQTPLFGAFCMEIAWQAAEGSKEIVPSMVRIYRPDELERDSQGHLNILESDRNGLLTRKPVAGMAPATVLFQLDRSYSAGGTLRNILYQELLRHDTLQEWAAYNKKLKGLIQGLYTSNATDEEIATAGEALKKMVEHNYTVTSKELEFKLNELASKGGAESFKLMKSEMEADAAIAILGQANTAQLPDSGGSRAALQVLNMIRTDIHFADQVRVSHLINRQLLTYDYQMNHQQGARKAPYKFRFIFDEAQDIEANARAAEILLRAGVPMEKDELYSKCGFTKPEDGADVFKAPSGSFSPGGSGL